MNAPYRPAQPQKAPRHVFTLDEVLDLQAKGFFADPKRIALHEGDIVEMAEDGDRHIALTMALNDAIRDQIRDLHYFKGVQTTLRFSAINAPSPDIYTLRGGPPQGDVAVERIALVIEVADTSLSDDLTDSAARYARAGVSEFWVIDARTLETHVHRDPQDGAYPPPQIVPGDAVLVPACVPELALRLEAV
jgi:Uma2 family endonuclease